MGRAGAGPREEDPLLGREGLAPDGRAPAGRHRGHPRVGRGPQGHPPRLRQG